MTSVSVPGNLLLMGEYAVLEEGGLGLTVAVEPGVAGRIEDGKELTAEGRFPGGRERWAAGVDSAGRKPRAAPAAFESGASRAAPAGSGGAGSFFTRTMDSLIRSIPAVTGVPAGSLSGHLVIDSTPLFDGHRKRGFGSSAAVAAAAALLLYRLAAESLPPHMRDEPTGRQLLQAAIAAHRHGQQNRGSGYDVAASMCGGLGLFTGGSEPALEMLCLPWLPGMAAIPGPHTVESRRAVRRYHRWKRQHPEEGAALIRQSNEAVRAFATASGWEEGREALRSARDLGIELGDRIGVPARIAMDDRPGCLCKAVGAGDELAVCIGACPEVEGRLIVRWKGPEWST